MLISVSNSLNGLIGHFSFMVWYLLYKRVGLLPVTSFCPMKGTQLGEFEELVLLTIARLYNDAYSAAVVEELSRRLERPMSLGAVHRTMQRLEEKGLVQSQFGQATAERGGRRKRLYTVTTAGEQTLQQVRQIRDELWAGIPKEAFGLA